MALFNRLNDLAKTFGEKTNDVIETGKLSARVMSERSAAGEDVKKIGEYYYNLFAAGGEIAPEVLEYCQSAQAHYTAAEDAQAEIDRIQAEKEAARAAAAPPPPGTNCPNCGVRNAPGVKFCNQCGTRLEPEPCYCPECGAKNEASTRFCGNCGHRLKEDGV